MGRRPCCSKELDLNRGAWTALEDKILTEYIRVHGEGKWRYLPERAGLKRCGKSCRLRWLNYLRPGIKRGSITEEEEDLIIRLHKLLGNRWALIAGRLPGRTDNEIKNYWHTKLSKTLKPKCGTEEFSSPKSSSHESLEEPKLTKKRRLSEPQPNLDDERKTGVVRTKARRFTKPVEVVPRLADQEHHQKLDNQGPFDQRSRSTSTTSEIEPLASSQMNLEEDSRQVLIPNFALDFDMDNDFLSDFFNTDWISELPCPENAGDQTISDGNNDIEGNVNSSARSEQTLLFPSEDTLPRSSDLESMASLIESTDHWDNWLQV